MLKKSFGPLGLDSDPCAPHLTLHRGTKLWLTNILSSTWLLANLHRYVHLYNNGKVLQTASGKRREGHFGEGGGATGVQLLQLHFHLLIDLASSAGLQIFKSLGFFLRFLCDIEKCDTPVIC